jgi:HK97 family phage major capsid protein
MPMTEVKKLLEDQGKAFEEFKKANDDCLKAKAEGKAFSEMEAKVEAANAEITRLSKELEEVAKKANRPPAGSDGGDPAKSEHKAAFLKFARKGDDVGLADVQKKAMNVTTDGDGGYAVPEELDRAVLDLMQHESPMRGLCNVITVGSPDYKKLVNKHGAGSGWVDEDDARTETATPALDVVAAVMGEIYANAFATQTSLDDLFFNVEQFIITELSKAFALEEGAAFDTGNGTKKPKGFLAYTQASTNDGTRAFGQIQYIPTGTAGAFKTASATVSPADDLITLIHKIKKGLRQDAAWMFNGLTLAAIRKWKDAEGNYLWQPGMQVGQPSMLLGYPVAENEDMPDIGSGTTPIAFGNWKRAYTIVDRIGIRTLRDPYTNKPYVGFYMTKRVGGMLVDSEAVKVLKLSAS